MQTKTPVKWEEKTLGDLISLEYGKGLDKTDRKLNGKYPAYGANGIKDRTDRFLYDKKTIIVGRKGSAGEINFTEDKFWALDVTYYAVFDEKILDLKFLYFILITLNLPSLANGIKPGINRNDVYTIPVKIPQLEEQKRIVKILDKAFEDIEQLTANAKQNMQNAKDLFESYLNKVFTANNWIETTLDEICELINRGVSPKYTEQNGLCVLNQKCIRNHEINYELARLHDDKVKSVNPERLIKLGDVLINSTGTGTLGRVAQVRNIPPKATVDSHVTIVRPKPGLFYNNFFGYALIFIENKIAESGEGCGGQTELSRDTLKNKFIISYPESIEEQHAIVGTLDKLKKQTKQLEQIYQQKIEQAEELKQSILQKAFNGEL